MLAILFGEEKKVLAGAGSAADGAQCAVSAVRRLFYEQRDLI
jgi:hypothetical protein